MISGTDEEHEPEQEALFELEGPDGDGCVWITHKDAGTQSTFNLGPRDKVAEAFADWLIKIDFEG